MTDEYRRPTCSFAKQLFDDDIICSSKCPAFKKCPQLILENAHLDTIIYNDEIYRKALEEARQALLELVVKK